MSRMQDIGGCRAVVSAADDAFNLAADLADSRIRHTLASYNNYIDEPRRTGYRGIHLVYSYHSDRVDQWQGLNTEIQIRSQFQHQWATAVETVGTFTGDELKSGRGSADWLRFFALMSSFIAGLEEKAIVPDTPANDRELFDEIGRLDATLGITERLAAFQSIAASLTGPRRSPITGLCLNWIYKLVWLRDTPSGPATWTVLSNGTRKGKWRAGKKGG